MGKTLYFHVGKTCSIGQKFGRPSHSMHFLYYQAISLVDCHKMHHNPKETRMKLCSKQKSVKYKGPILSGVQQYSLS